MPLEALKFHGRVLGPNQSGFREIMPIVREIRFAALRFPEIRGMQAPDSRKKGWRGRGRNQYIIEGEGYGEGEGFGPPAPRRLAHGDLWNCWRA